MILATTRRFWQRRIINLRLGGKMVKRFFGLLGVTMLGLGLSTTALHADLPKVGEFYANVGLAWLDVAFEGRSSVGNANDLPQDIDVAAGVLQIGKQINEHIAAELRLGYELTEKTHEYKVPYPNTFTMRCGCQP